jgi:hypothetical protein
LVLGVVVDVFFALLGGTALTMFGVVQIKFTLPLSRMLATANLWLYRDGQGTWRMGIVPPPSKTRIRWMEAIKADPSSAPDLLWLIRAMGVVLLLIGGVLFAAGTAWLVD